MDALRLWENMGTVTSERSQAPVRQGYFVVTAELPEIQTVTVWTPCCAPMSALSNKKNRMYASVVVRPETVRMSKAYFGWDDTGDGAISIVYSYIRVQPYTISGKKCLVEMKIYPLLCNVNDTKRLRRDAPKSGRWYEMSLNNTMTPDGDWLIGQSVAQLNLRQVTTDFQRDRLTPMRGW